MKVMIGGAAGFARDRRDSAGHLVAALARHVGPRYLMLEMLAERTLALAATERRLAPQRGYIAAFEPILRPHLAACFKAGIKVVGNFGAANPRGAAGLILDWAAEQGLKGLRVAVVEGDCLLQAMSRADLERAEIEGALLQTGAEIVAANAYLGAAPIAQALAEGADIVVTGRVADPALALGPLIHAFGWDLQDWDRLAAGALAGHLLECGSQVTGGYFADPGVKDVPGMADLGYPLAVVAADGRFEITKPEGTGGRVDLATVTEQMLYEIHDPSAYITPDVVLDLTAVELEGLGENRVGVSGARGRPRPDTLKATVCVDGGFLAEAEISYAGPNAEARARLALEVVRARVARFAPRLALRGELIGLVSVFGEDAGVTLAGARRAESDPDLRLRLAAEAATPAEGQILLDEVEALYCAGPAGGGGVRSSLKPRLKSTSVLVARDVPRVEISILEAADAR